MPGFLLQERVMSAVTHGMLLGECLPAATCRIVICWFHCFVTCMNQHTLARQELHPLDEALHTLPADFHAARIRVEARRSASNSERLTTEGRVYAVVSTTKVLFRGFHPHWISLSKANSLFNHRVPRR